MSYYKKYMMYKQKYADLKNMLGGASTRCNSYQPSLMNMLGGMYYTMSGYNYNNSYHFTDQILKEFASQLSEQATDPEGVRPRMYQIILYEKRYTDNQIYDKTFQTNKLEDFYSKEVGGKYDRNGRIMWAGEIKTHTVKQFENILLEMFRKNNFKLIDVKFL